MHSLPAIGKVMAAMPNPRPYVPVRPHICCAVCNRPFARGYVPLGQPAGTPMGGRRVCGDCRRDAGLAYPGHDSNPHLNWSTPP